MRRVSGLLVAAFVSGAVAPAIAQSWTGDANLLLAGKRLDSNDWGAADRQGEIGVLTDWSRRDWPVAVAADLLLSGRSASVSGNGFNELRGRTSELDLGVRKIWRPDPHFRPYVGGGLALVSADMRFTGPAGTSESSNGGAGIWLGGGVAWTLGEALNLGLDARFTQADVNVDGGDVNAGGFSLGLLVGYHWGG